MERASVPPSANLIANHSPPSRLLDVVDLVKTYRVDRVAVPWRRPREVRAVRAVNFSLGDGEVIGLVGESGSGKSTIGRCILGLETPTSGTVKFNGRPISGDHNSQRVALRRNVQMVFQDPKGSLNPRMTVEDIIAEPLLLLTHSNSNSRRRAVRELLAEVGLSTGMAGRYRHQLSGGEQQRVSVARALVIRPRLVVLDEPVSALDASVRAQVLALFMDLQVRHELAYLYISHDLHTVRAMCQRVMIMCRGRIVESAGVQAIFDRPRHPYTKLLLSSVLTAEVPDAATGPGFEAPGSDHFDDVDPSRAISDAVDQLDDQESALVEVEPGHFLAANIVSGTQS